jgi:hypothetical protein
MPWTLRAVSLSDRASVECEPDTVAPLALHLDGTGWQTISSDNPPAASGVLESVADIAPYGFQSAWAVLTSTAYEQWCQRHGVTPLVRSVAGNATQGEISQVVRELVTDNPGCRYGACYRGRGKRGLLPPSC